MIRSQPLSRTLRSQLENVVKAARDAAEQAARAVLDQLAIAEARAPDYLSEAQKALRRRLRAHGRALGDVKHLDESQEVRHLIGEVAYEHWHRMLFARFLAENGLLLWEPGAPVSLDDCREMVDQHPDLAMGAKSPWDLAGQLAARMLPQVFKPQNPVFALRFAPEHQRELERLLSSLSPDIFQASDSLGWVYQFWQTKRKDEVNAAEIKVGADELPAVTQLFTEPYMVDFLLQNSLGAWWAAQRLSEKDWCTTTGEEVLRQSLKREGVNLPFLRFVKGDGATGERWQPAAGTYPDWPQQLGELKVLDPCCGSGHFLVAAFLLLVPMRQIADGLSARAAVDAVLRDNLHGLEIDPRCVEIAVFALALAAWRYPDIPSPTAENGRVEGNALGVRPEMPSPNIACCGLKVAAKAPIWEALVPDTHADVGVLRAGLRQLHDTFAQAPLLGSLLDPRRRHQGDMFTADYDTLKILLEAALAREATRSESEDAWDSAVAAQGLLAAAQLLDGRYHLVVTNVPYLARGKQCDALKDYCASHYPAAKNDLANVFLERCLELAIAPTETAGSGVVQVVMPQNWLFLGSYKKQREQLLRRVRWNLLVRLGEGGFQSSQAAGAFTILLTQTNVLPQTEALLYGLDASNPRTVQDKAELLRVGEVVAVSQQGQLGNPDARVALEDSDDTWLLGEYAEAIVGLQTGDDPRFISVFWEHTSIDRNVWEFLQNTPDMLSEFSGMSGLVKWEQGNGALFANPAAMPTKGLKALGLSGIAIHRMRIIFPYHFAKERLHQNVAAIIPHNSAHLPAIWCFCSSPEYNETVRQLDQSLKVTNATLVKVPFDLDRWTGIAAEKYPHGLPQPYSNDPTQWIFHGHPCGSVAWDEEQKWTVHGPLRIDDTVLQVAVARLLGYRWPAETDVSMELATEQREWVERCAALATHTDYDGIVCLPSVRGEKPAHERLLGLLIDAWESVAPGSWTPSVLDQLLATVDNAGKSLEVWLRDKFFEQHAKMFHHRPFIWQVWDGLNDGFSALINYHQLDAKNLERLIHTYLGDWIRQQEAGVHNGVDGAVLRLSAAQDLKHRLEAIRYGESPYDIFIRWKSLEEQPIGWHPDLNDGVRLNIRPWMTTEVLRHNKPPKLNIKWDKDRGKDVASAPWYPVFQGDRINDHHLTLEYKQAAKEGE